MTGEQEYPVPPLVHEEGVGFFLARARAVDPTSQADEAVSRDLPPPRRPSRSRSSSPPPASRRSRREQILERLDAAPAAAHGRRARPARAPAHAARDDRVELRPAHRRRGAALRPPLPSSAGGCTLEAAEEVCDADLDTLQSLVDKSLLRSPEERFWMLETIREYARERLRVRRGGGAAL